MLSFIKNKNSTPGLSVKFISPLVLLMIVLCTIIYATKDYYYNDKAMNNHILIISKIISNNYKDSHLKHKMAEWLKMEPGINAANFINNKDELIAAYSIDKNLINIQDNTNYTKKIDIIDADKSKKIGTLYVYTNYSQLNIFLINLMYLSSWFLLGAISILIVFAYFYLQYLSNYLTKTKSSIKKAADEIKNLNENLNPLLSAHQELDIQNNYQKLQFAAYHDELTLLPNIRLFKLILERQINTSKNNNSKFAVLFIDVDNFKQINDNYGHDIGNELLKIISNNFRNTLRSNDKVLPISRMGGDEFTIIIDHIDSHQDVGHIANRINKSISNIKNIKGYNISISLSIGIAIYPDHGNTGATLLKHADAAMYYAKAGGKNRYQYYNDQIGSNIQHRISIEAQLSDAIINDEFFVEYQPIFNLITRELVGLEALVRWQNPEKGVIGPNEFIDISEDSGLICTINDIVIDKICTDIISWIKSNINYVKVAINISSKQFDSHNFVENICMNIAKYGIRFNSIELELTEQMLAKDFEQDLKKINELKSLGFILSIDDFGTGYSSFKCLSSLSVDNIKIDRSFIKNLNKNNNYLKTVKSIVTLAHSLNIKVIAEGVEEQEHVDTLIDFKCDFAQGFYYSKPLSHNLITEFIKTNFKGNPNSMVHIN